MKIVKIVVFVPKDHMEAVWKAMGDAGAGKIGNYSYCTFITKGVGKYLPEKGAKPFVGEVGKFEEVKEEKLEMVCPKEKAKKIIAAMKKAHPYDEVAFDIYPLLDEKNLNEAHKLDE